MRENFKELVAKELKQLRIDHNLTQNQLSNICNVDTSTIVRYEKNNVTMQIDTIIKIIEPFGIDIAIFFKSIIAKTQTMNNKNQNLQE